MEKPTDYSKETRRVYHAQHMRLADDDRAMKRHMGMFTEEYFGLGKDWFKGKKVLDAGCGDTAKALIRFYQFGARNLHGMEMGTEFIPVAEKSAEKWGVPVGTIAFKSGSVLEIPYPDNTFDFVCCHGVLIHLNSMEEVEEAFKELARVTKPGGMLYIVFGIVGGLFEEYVDPAIRKFYYATPDFKKFIDNLKPEDIHGILRKIANDMKEHTGEDVSMMLPTLFNFFDVDFCVFIQNMIQAPIRLPIQESFIREHYAEHGFENLRKLRRYVKRDNIRKFMAPLHYDKEYFLSRWMYGSGNLEFIAQKKK